METAWGLGFGWGWHVRFCGHSLNTHKVFQYHIWICCTSPCSHSSTAVCLPQTAEPRPLDNLLSVLTDFLEGAGNGFYFTRSDQRKIIPIKKLHWARRTASVHLPQNRPTAKFSLLHVLFMAESPFWCLELIQWDKSCLVNWAERIFSHTSQGIFMLLAFTTAYKVKEPKSECDLKYSGTQLSMAY